MRRRKHRLRLGDGPFLLGHQLELFARAPPACAPRPRLVIASVGPRDCKFRECAFGGSQFRAGLAQQPAGNGVAGLFFAINVVLGKLTASLGGFDRVRQITERQLRFRQQRLGVRQRRLQFIRFFQSDACGRSTVASAFCTSASQSRRFASACCSASLASTSINFATWLALLDKLPFNDEQLFHNAR